MHLTGAGRPVASFDPEGLIFAAGIESKQLKLYDLRSFDKVCPHAHTHRHTHTQHHGWFVHNFFLHSLLLGSILHVSCSARFCWLWVDRYQVQFGWQNDTHLNQHITNQDNGCLLWLSTAGTVGQSALITWLSHDIPLITYLKFNDYCNCCMSHV